VVSLQQGAPHQRAHETSGLAQGQGAQKTVTYCYWQLALTEEQVLHLTFDRTDARVNALSALALSELGSILDALLRELADSKPRGLVIGSGKSNGFIAGADVTEFPALSTKDEVSAWMRKGQKVFNRLSHFPIPTVALIDGFCLGGGAELALACDYRVASQSTKTRIGFPEINLGLHPGLGGTVMLPQYVGFIKAFQLMQSGEPVGCEEALTLGLFDEVVPRADLVSRAAQYVGAKPPRLRRSMCCRLVTNRHVLRVGIAAYLSCRYVKAAAPAVRPILSAILENWRKYGVGAVQRQSALAAEAESIAAFVVSPLGRRRVASFLEGRNARNSDTST